MQKKIISLFLGLILIGIVSLSLVKKTINHIDMTTIKGEKISSQNLIGKVYLINFWATDCPGCIKEMPGLINTYNKYKDRNFEIIAVAMFYDPPSRVLNYTKENSGTSVSMMHSKANVWPAGASTKSFTLPYTRYEHQCTPCCTTGMGL